MIYRDQALASSRVIKWTQAMSLFIIEAFVRVERNARDKFSALIDALRISHPDMLP